MKRRAERELFTQGAVATRGLDFGNQSRIVKIAKTRVPLDPAGCQVAPSDQAQVVVCRNEHPAKTVVYDPVDVFPTRDSSGAHCLLGRKKDLAGCRQPDRSRGSRRLTRQTTARTTLKRIVAGNNLKPWLLALSFTTLLLLVPAAAVDQSEAGANKYFRRALSTVRTHFNIPALGGVLVMDGKVVVAGATGVRKQGNPIPVTDDDRFPIGSITKTFTGFVVSRLVQQNTVTWATSIQDVFPNIGSEQGIQPAYPPKMLAELMTHQADFPRDGNEGTICNTSNFTDYMLCGRNEFMRTNMKAMPQPSQVYSNIDPVIVANMVQQRTGQTWEQLVRDHIYTPLGLSAGFISSVDVDSIAEPQFHQETGYLNLANKHVPYTDGDKHNIGAPAGHVTISPKDMGKYLIELMPGVPGRVGALSDPTLTEHLEQFNTNRRVVRGGWIVDATSGETTTNWAPGQRILAHDGSHLKNYSRAQLLPDAKVGFCTMANSSRGGAGTSRGVGAVTKLNEHFKMMWYNQNVLTFFDEALGFKTTASSTASNNKYQIANLNDTDMLTSWRAAAPGSSLQLNTSKRLARLRGLVLIYPRAMHNIKELKIFATAGNGAESLLYAGTIDGNDNSVFEIEPAVGVNSLRVEFVNKSSQPTEIAEILLLYDDPVGRMSNKLKGLKAIDKVLIKAPPALGILKK
jgi:CubicO group peptidase (beta-lactamase class C family)